ncbi:MAG TPA: alpha/beta fold hydrolase [Verrucomicrobiae bacterium]|nr:alpha/beta fold hydrolase [Verrucomicrobiae bacterium]
MAFFHAWRMTHFQAARRGTGSPLKLSVIEKIGVLATGVTLPRPKCDPVGPDDPQPSRTVHFSARDGVKLEAWDIPAETNRMVAVLFHGHVSAKSGMLGEARALRELGVRTILVDFRGSGGSDGMVTTLGWDEAMDVAAAATWARHEWPERPLILYGTSMGAAAVLRAVAVEDVRPDGIVLECAFDNLLRTVSHRYHAMGLPAFPFAELLVFLGGVQHGFNAFRHNPAEYAKVVTCPALVLDGERDPWVWPAEAHRVAAAMRGTAECHIFPNGGHGGYWADMPEDYRRTVAEWMRTTFH